jgi:ubiquinone/menaquinone biosynthesis C-methylase UbiE
MLTVDFDRLRLPPGAVVLDLGCGDGRHARAARLLSGVALVAADVAAAAASSTAASLRRMAHASAAFREAADAGPWLAIRTDTHRLPFADESFDCVIAAEILEHVEDDEQVLAEIYRVLKPGGELALSVPRFGPELVCWMLSKPYRNSPGGHVRIYRRSQLARKIAQRGFELFDAHFAHALHTPYWWLKCLLGLHKTDGLVGLYHRFLVWEIMSRPRSVQMLERLLNPVLGKSEVFYARKPSLIRQMVPVQLGVRAALPERIVAAAQVRNSSFEMQGSNTGGTPRC